MKIYLKPQKPMKTAAGTVIVAFSTVDCVELFKIKQAYLILNRNDIEQEQDLTKVRFLVVRCPFRASGAPCRTEYLCTAELHATQLHDNRNLKQWKKRKLFPLVKVLVQPRVERAQSRSSARASAR